MHMLRLKIRIQQIQWMSLLQIERLTRLVAMDSGSLVLVELPWPDSVENDNVHGLDTMLEGLELSPLGIVGATNQGEDEKIAVRRWRLEPSWRIMSSSATIGSDHEHSNCVQQTSTGGHRGTRRGLGVNSSSPSVDGDHGPAAFTLRRQWTPLTSAVEPGTHEGNARRTRQTRPPPIAAVEQRTGAETRGRRQTMQLPIANAEPGTGAENATRTRQRSTQSTAAVVPGTGAENATRTRQRRTQPAAAVEPSTGTENATRTRQRRTQRTAAVQPGIRERNTTRKRPRNTPSASDVEPCTDEDNDRPTRPKRSRVFEHDLAPEQRAIPDTGLLQDLGYHVSAYARAGRGPPTRNLNCRGAWKTAVELYREAHDQYKELFINAGFGEFLKIEPVDVPVAYFLALTERWFWETNTLHLPSCEIGPTPVDWTMVTGLSFGGRRIEASPEFKIERALDLLGKPGAIKDGKIYLKDIKPKRGELTGIPPTDEAREKNFRRLFLYVVASCFFNNNRSVIDHSLVECLERINDVGSYDWGEFTYAFFLAAMRRKVTAEIGALTAFWQFLPFWAFEYLDVNRPMHKEGDVFPRASRWICSKDISENESPEFIGPRFIASRCQLNYVEESQVTWQPYLASQKYRSDAVQYAIGLAKMRIRFQSIYTWEYYLGERCRRQIGFPCQVPNHPPRTMYGTKKGRSGNGISAESLVKENLEYASWFAANSIGRILDVNRFLGGPDIAAKVLDQWRAKHMPDLIPIEQSQYEKLKEDRNALEEECAKLREELSQATGESCHV
ncbi:PMD domain-containing protein [Heracleum sosnowskyi]|uniref:PMD domain-containing protein n=1 Tax=Heracleum sosnowskyi TaxID=360622 RepID=A0AAD8HUC1_9APIA|nr:PMD domain-containing protein [Heracleum sosnowskyi]